MFFVPTTVVEQKPLAPDASSDYWYGNTDLGALLMAQERAYEAKMEQDLPQPKKVITSPFQKK